MRAAAGPVGTVISAAVGATHETCVAVEIGNKIGNH